MLTAYLLIVPINFFHNFDRFFTLKLHIINIYYCIDNCLYHSILPLRYLLVIYIIWGTGVLQYMYIDIRKCDISANETILHPSHNVFLWFNLSFVFPSN